MIMKKFLLLATSFLSMLPVSAEAQDRYQNRPPVIVSPDLTAPWVMQLTGERVRPAVYRPPSENPSSGDRQSASWMRWRCSPLPLCALRSQ
jgi:hypothetical protein